jgi:putative FmdB family regulatory protein
MPIFEYQCADCGNRFEKLLRRASDEAELSCPKCGQKHLDQQLSTFSAHANGSASRDAAPVCPSGMCSNPGLCGRN